MKPRVRAPRVALAASRSNATGHGNSRPRRQHLASHPKVACLTRPSRQHLSHESALSWFQRHPRESSWPQSRTDAPTKQANMRVRDAYSSPRQRLLRRKAECGSIQEP